MGTVQDESQTPCYTKKQEDIKNVMSKDRRPIWIQVSNKAKPELSGLI